MASPKAQPQPLAPETRHSRAREQLAGLARRIRSMREQKGLTQEDFAARCGISVSFASLLERGERSPSHETLVEVAQALEVSMSELFRDSPIEAYDDPYYARLIDFARKGRISRAQVDRLVAVGHAMFGLDGLPKQPLPATRRDAAGCSHEGCHRPVLAKGLCASHYHRARRARL
ncbi:MAG: helix-turn-helix domain-containing protein [Myxococcaceae bacterium]